MSDTLKGSLSSLQICLLVNPEGQSGEEIWKRESYSMEANDISKVPSLSLPVGFGQWEARASNQEGGDRGRLFLFPRSLPVSSFHQRPQLLPGRSLLEPQLLSLDSSNHIWLLPFRLGVPKAPHCLAQRSLTILCWIPETLS